MAKVVHIRDVPDDVHAVLTEQAAAQGLSLTRYLQRELAHLARRAEAVEHNAVVIRRVRDRVGAPVDRDTILSVLHDGRGE